MKNQVVQTVQKLFTPYEFSVQPWKNIHLSPQANPRLIPDLLWRGKKKPTIHFSFKIWIKQDSTIICPRGWTSPGSDYLTIRCLCQALADNSSRSPIRALQLSCCTLYSNLFSALIVSANNNPQLIATRGREIKRMVLGDCYVCFQMNIISREGEKIVIASDLVV